MPNVCKHEARPRNSEVMYVNGNIYAHSAMHREKNEPKAILKMSY